MEGGDSFASERTSLRAVGPLQTSVGDAESPNVTISPTDLLVMRCFGHMGRKRMNMRTFVN